MRHVLVPSVMCELSMFWKWLYAKLQSVEGNYYDTCYCLAHQPEDKSKLFLGLAIKVDVEINYLKCLFVLFCKHMWAKWVLSNCTLINAIYTSMYQITKFEMVPFVTHTCFRFDIHSKSCSFTLMFNIYLKVSLNHCRLWWARALRRITFRKRDNLPRIEIHI